MANEAPWVVIAVMIHVLIIAICSVIYFAHNLGKDSSEKTSIEIAAPRQEIEQILPPEVVDREQMPDLQNPDMEQNELKEFSEDTKDPPKGDETAPSDSELLNLPSGGFTGGTAIGLNGPGHVGIAPSTGSGRLGGGKYGSRFGGDGKGGRGGKSTAEAVKLGLEWLKKHQDSDGHWDTASFMKHDVEGVPCDGAGNPVNDVGITGLATLAFLGEGNTLRIGSYKKVVQAAVKWMMENQGENGLLGANNSEGYIYSHAIGTLALCEAYGLSDYRPLKKPVQEAINYIATARNNYGVWRYQPKGGDSDTSVTGWMVQALLSAKEFGLQVDEQAFKAAQVWFDNVTDVGSGASGYTQRNEGSSRRPGLLDKFPSAKSEAMTAVVLLCRYLMHQDPKDVPTMKTAADRILKLKPAWNKDDGSIDMYYW
ncbi:MAG TPA: hypothetical protein VK348_02545, partial [Planctomycetota bacterium]|nr:hypothetical protein [Planctomycetota bacterium]